MVHKAKPISPLYLRNREILKVENKIVHKGVSGEVKLKKNCSQTRQDLGPSAFSEMEEGLLTSKAPPGTRIHPAGCAPNNSGSPPRATIRGGTGDSQARGSLLWSPLWEREVPGGDRCGLSATEKSSSCAESLCPQRCDSGLGQQRQLHQQRDSRAPASRP